MATVTVYVFASGVYTTHATTEDVMAKHKQSFGNGAARDVYPFWANKMDAIFSERNFVGKSRSLKTQKQNLARKRTQKRARSIPSHEFKRQ